MTTEIIYLDNAATSWPKPPALAQAITSYFTSPNGNPGRGGHRASANAARTVEAARARLASLINAEDPSRLILAHSATDALNTAIHGAIDAAAELPQFKPRPHVVTTVLEHNAVLRPLYALQHKQRIDLTLVTCDHQGFVDPDQLINACNERTALLAVTHASNVLGTIQPIRRIGEKLRQHSPHTLFIVDASQTVGHIPVDVRNDHADLLAFPTHKALLGPPGIGALYISPRAYSPDDAQPRLDPHVQGGTGGNSDDPLMPRALPHHFEAGTCNAPGLAGLLAALDEHQKLHSNGAHTREKDLTGQLLAFLLQTPGVRVLGPRDTDHRVSVVSFTLHNHDAGELASILDASFNIAVRAGLQCAPGAHHAMGTDVPAQTGECGAKGGGGAVRASPGPYSTQADVDAFKQAITRIIADT